MWGIYFLEILYLILNSFYNSKHKLRISEQKATLTNRNQRLILELRNRTFGSSLELLVRENRRSNNFTNWLFRSQIFSLRLSFYRQQIIIKNGSHFRPNFHILFRGIPDGLVQPHSSLFSPSREGNHRFWPVYLGRWRLGSVVFKLN